MLLKYINVGKVTNIRLAVCLSLSFHSTLPLLSLYSFSLSFLSRLPSFALTSSLFPSFAIVSYLPPSRSFSHSLAFITSSPLSPLPFSLLSLSLTFYIFHSLSLSLSFSFFLSFPLFPSLLYFLFFLHLTLFIYSNHTIL